MSDPLRPEIRTLAEYSLVQHSYRIKLNQNENPYELPPAIKKEIADRLVSATWSRYPSFVPQRQLEMLAAFTGWTADGILIGNGSNEILQLLFASVIEKGTPVVLSQPTFTLYGILARGFGARVQDVMMRPGFTFDVDEIIRVTNECRAAMLVLCSPNNPTGTRLPRHDLLKILEATDALVVLDEAYVHFDEASHIPLLQTHERLVILQTFSKAMGAAGLRFGYSLSSPGIASGLRKFKLPYNVNVFTLLAAEVLMARWETIRSWIAKIVSERERVRSALGAMKEAVVYPSGGNFLLFESQITPATEVFRRILHEGILIRDVSAYPQLKRGLRVTIGKPEENDGFLNALRKAV